MDYEEYIGILSANLYM